MVDAIVARLDPEAIRLRTHVRRVYPENGGWRVAIEMNGDERYDAVISRLPPMSPARLLDGVDRELARNLLDITYSSSVTVTLGYYMDQLTALPPGFGFLVPRSEGTRMLACTFVHNKFPHRAPAGQRHPALLPGRSSRRSGPRPQRRRDPGDGAARTQEHCQAGCPADFRARVPLARSHGAVRAGTHRARARIEKRVAEIPGLALAGNAYHGIGVPDCIRSGMEAANTGAG